MLLLLIVYLGFIMGDGPTRGLLDLPVEDGFNVRMVMLVAAAWFALFAVPLLLTAQHITPLTPEPPPSIGLFGAYRRVWADLRMEWARDRNLVYYLLASAVFRDGLAASSPSARCSASRSTASRRPTS